MATRWVGLGTTCVEQTGMGNFGGKKSQKMKSDAEENGRIVLVSIQLSEAERKHSCSWELGLIQSTQTF